MPQELKQVCRYGFGLSALAAFLLLVFFISWPYNQLQAVFQQFNAERNQFFPWNGFTGKYGFSERTYYATLTGYGLLLATSLFCFYRLRPAGPGKSTSGKSLPTTIFRKFKTVWSNLSYKEKALITFTGMVLVLVRFYLLQDSRINLDEAVTLIFYLRKGLPGVLLYYSLPNNHLLYNLLCLPLQYVFEDPFWLLKLPAFVLSILGTGVLYLAYRSVLPFAVAFFALAVFEFSQYALYFSVHGRGYLPLSLAAALAALALYKLYERKEGFYWLIFMACSMLGFFAIPVFLLPFTATFLFGLIAFIYNRNLSAVKNLLVAASFISLITLLLHSPALLVSGPELLFGNKYVSSKTTQAFYSEFPFLFTYTQGSVVGQETVGFYFWLLGFTGISVLLLFATKFRKALAEAGLKPIFLFLLWCNMLLPWVFIFLQRVRPPERILYYKGFFDFLAMVILCYLAGFYFFRKQFKIGWAAGLIFLAAFGGYEINKVRKHLANALPVSGFDNLLQKIQQSGAKTIYSNEIYYSTNLRHEYFKQNSNGVIIDEYTFNPTALYEVIILNKYIAPPAGLSLEKYTLYHEDQFVKIFFRKGFPNKQMRL